MQSKFGSMLKHADASMKEDGIGEIRTTNISTIKSIEDYTKPLINELREIKERIEKIINQYEADTI